MNNIESKNFIELMQNVYDRSLLATSPKNFIPIAGEYAQILYANPLLEDIRLSLANMGKEDFARLKEVCKTTLSELEKTMKIISSYAKNAPILSTPIKEYDGIKKQCSRDSYEFIPCLVHILEKFCRILLWEQTTKSVFISPKDHTKILKKLVKLDDKNNITGFIFAPSLTRFYQELEILERNKKIVPYNSYSYLTELHLFYDIKNRSSRIQVLEPSVSGHLSLKAKDFDQVLEEERSEVSRALGFDMEECKIHMHNVLSFLKSGRFFQNIKNVNQEDSYDEATGILIRDGKKTEFMNSRLPSKILSLLHPNGKPIDFISDEDIYYGAIKLEADPEWYHLDKEDRIKNKRLIYQACRTINASAKNDYDKENKQKFLNLKGCIVSPNRNSSK